MFKDAYKFASKFVKAPRRDTDNSLARHIDSIHRWSRSINMFGMARSLETDQSSIALSISVQPRRFFENRNLSAVTSEMDVILSERSCAILGDPGSGKTTIVKRLLRKIISDDPELAAQDVGFPIVVFGRDINKDNSLFEDIFKKIGFELISPDISINDSKAQQDWLKERKSQIESAVSVALHEANVILFIDGVDEIDERARDIFNKESAQINDAMSVGKIIMTCRSGDWRNSYSNCDILELCSLSDNEIREIIDVWANEPDRFMDAINVIPYRDILDRPLFLTMLVVVFNQTGNLPGKPVDVYGRITNLLISKWDEERGVRRLSAYDDFFSERKFKFLCAMSYFMTNELKLSRFSGSDLKRAYAAICEQFSLPAGEADLVVREIESHTGLIVESGFAHSEFCHLTVQEYLSAAHLTSLPSDRAGGDMMLISPATVAVATCLSGNPTLFFFKTVGGLLNNQIHHKEIGAGVEIHMLVSYVRRLKLEQATFVRSKLLGATIMMLLYAFDVGARDDFEPSEFYASIDFILDNDSAAQSLGDTGLASVYYKSPSSDRLAVEIIPAKFPGGEYVGLTLLSYSRDTILRVMKFEKLSSVAQRWLACLDGGLNYSYHSL
ncbi:NACHT domain-containing protein [Sphingomonas sp. RT2P30]|uniref:NACHT domain-containing protein n=1 Tax=Parasphingomonas halimpatiens TaxID=3096162 RepID=UPI002FCB8087